MSPNLLLVAVMGEAQLVKNNKRESNNRLNFTEDPLIRIRFYSPFILILGK
jgi:hypothetical protein